MTVLLFGVTRDIVKKSTLHLNARDSEKIESVSDLKRYLLLEYPALAGLTSIAVAVNQQYAHEDHPLTEMDEIALIPPVSGG